MTEQRSVCRQIMGGKAIFAIYVVISRKYVKKEHHRAIYGTDSGISYVLAKGSDLNRRFVAAFMALVFAISCLVIGVNFAARAEVDDDGFNMLEASDDSGFVTRKGLRYNEASDTYDLRMEAYATAPIATKAIDTTETPLDVVMVLNQSESMGTPDIWNGEYEEAIGTFSIENAIGKYYKVGDQYYPVQYDMNGYVEVQETNSDAVKNSWTAVQANQYYSNLSQQGRGLYYDNSGVDDVLVKRETRYTTYSGSIDVGNLSHEAFEGHYDNSTDYFVYVPHSGNGADNISCWHRVYYLESGYAGVLHTNGYFYTFYYYVNDVEGSGIKNSEEITSGSAGDLKGSGKSQVKLLTNYEALATRYSVRLFSYVAISEYGKKWSNNSGNAGTDGRLYQATTASSVYNYLSTESGIVLACQEPNTNQSHTYNGSLYTEGYQLYYQTDPNDPNTKHYIGNSVFKENNDIAYDSEATGAPLYEKEYITRTEAQQLAATELAQKIAEAVSEGKVHRIAVVGSKGNNAVKTALVPANENDADPSNTVNDTIDIALDSLAASGGSIAIGLENAQSVFASNSPLDPADSRKRIVVVFTDDDASDSNALSAAANLKDTYNASVYVVGYPDNSGNATVDGFLSHMSSEYFATATNPITETENDDGKTYHYYGADKVSILSAIDAVANEIQSPTTKVALGSTNSVLKDIISDNFDASNITVSLQPVEGHYDNDTIDWGGTGNTAGISESHSGNKISVTGFDFNGKYIDPDHAGEKLVVTISGLKLNEKVKTDSDKRIYSNKTDSGIYKTGAEELLISTFPRPFVDNKTMMAPAGGTGVYNEAAKAFVNKYISPNENGKYDLTLEAYTTDVNKAVVEKIPTDFVIVVDQSGSMSTEDMPTGYKKVSGTKTLEQIASGTYYILADDGNYYRVYPTRDYLYRYYPANYWYVGAIVDQLGTRLGWGMRETESTTNFENQFYFREVANGKTYYQPITTTIQGVPLTYYIRFKYTNANGEEVDFLRNDTTYSSNGNSPWFRNVITGNTMRSGLTWAAANAAVQTIYREPTAYTFSELLGANTGMYVNYPMYDRHVGYNELRYRDVNGVEHTVASKNGQGKWEFCNANGQAITTNSGSTRPAYGDLYEASGTITRLEALQNALTAFAQEVSTEKDDIDYVDNRIAIVGFSSDGYNNNEILTNTTDGFSVQTTNWVNQSSSSHYSRDGRAHDGIQYNVAENNSVYYENALVPVHDDTAADGVNPIITNGIAGITAHGGTQPEVGLDMAKKILDDRSDKTYTTRTDPQTFDRNTIVIFFTDGQPGNYAYSDQYAEANEVVEVAQQIKASQYNTNIFSIGVFGESDGNPLTYNETNLKDPYNNRSYWPYMGGYVETYQENNNYYLLRRQWRPGNPAYTEQANDAIYDYMSVTSSNYPDATEFIAPAWLNGTFNGSYIDATDGVRGKATALPANEFYRMASSQDTLVSAFAQAVTLTQNTISSEARLDSAAILRDILTQNTFVTSDTTTIRTATVEGEMDRNGVVNFDPNTTTNVNVSATLGEADGKTTINVRGFDYLKNYIKYGKKANYEGTGNRENQGKKLVVTITDVYPDKKGAIGPTGDLVKSNEPESAIYVGATPQAKFPEPAITRHSYTLDVGDVNRSATFDVSAAIVLNGTEVDPSNDDLADVIIVYPNGNRALYSSVGPQTFAGMKGGETFYFENVPNGYMVQTNVTSTDDAYNYSIRFENESPVPMGKGVAIPYSYNYADKTIHITSARSNKQVSIWEQTIGSYANTDDVFYEAITMDIPVIDGEDNSGSTYSYDATFNGNPYTAVFTKTSSNGVISTKLTALTSKDSSPTITFVEGKLPMKHDDRLVIDLPTGNTVKVNEAPNDMDYTVEYYYGQDQVDASSIRLNAADGTVLEGTHEVTLVPVNGIDEEPLKVTFTNGHITKIGNMSVDPDKKLTLAPYQVVSTDEALSDAVLDMDGTRVSFDEETDGNNTAYVATIKRISSTPPVSVTLERNNMDILILNEKGDIPITGIMDSDNHNWIIYILAALGGLAAIGAGIFLWKKKDEFVDQ